MISNSTKKPRIRFQTCLSHLTEEPHLYITLVRNILMHMYMGLSTYHNCTLQAIHVHLFQLHS